MKYRVVLADPPWKLRDRGSRLAPSHNGKHYDVLSEDDIRAAGAFVREVTTVESFLFLWAPNALVIDGTATRVCKSWGYQPKQLITWVKTSKDGKPRLGGGHYSRVCTEQLVLARRGRPSVRDRGVPGVIHAPRTRHSAKPDESYELIERLVEGPYLELYARRRYSDNWTAWGNECPTKTMQ